MHVCHAHARSQPTVYSFLHAAGVAGAAKMNVLNRESFTSHCREKQQPEQVNKRHGYIAPPSSAMPTDAASGEEAVRGRCHSCTEQPSPPFTSSNVGHLKDAHPPWKGSPSIPTFLTCFKKNTKIAHQEEKTTSTSVFPLRQRQTQMAPHRSADHLHAAIMRTR